MNLIRKFFTFNQNIDDKSPNKKSCCSLIIKYNKKIDIPNYISNDTAFSVYTNNDNTRICDVLEIDNEADLMEQIKKKYFIQLADLKIEQRKKNTVFPGHISTYEREHFFGNNYNKYEFWTYRFTVD